MQRYKGTVISFRNNPGYGFIKRENESDLFVHFSDIVCDGFKTLKRGQVVSFGIGQNNMGRPKAIEVVIEEE